MRLACSSRVDFITMSLIVSPLPSTGIKFACLPAAVQAAVSEVRQAIAGYRALE